MTEIILSGEPQQLDVDPLVQDSFDLITLFCEIKDQAQRTRLIELTRALTLLPRPAAA